MSAPPRRFSAARSSRAITGSVVFVDNGFNVMGMAVPDAGT